jgi:hypothetical protein
LRSGSDGAVALVTLGRPPRRLVLKVAAREVTSEEARERALIQHLWSLEYRADTPRHRADTAALCRRFGVPAPTRVAWLR